MSPRSIASLFVPLLVFEMAIWLAGCAQAEYQTRPFFQHEKEVQTHGKKTWFDHLVELDPGAVDFHLASDYQQNPPQRIAVLPFVDRNGADFIVDKIRLSMRNEQERNDWAWTYANRLRRNVAGRLAEREFTLVNMLTVDSALASRGITDYDKMAKVPPQQLGEWLSADAVVYGEVLHYEAYYALLIAIWRVAVRIKIVSTRDGHVIFEATGTRNATDVQPAVTPIDIAINSGLTLLEVRDVNLARAEEEVGREVLLRLPRSERNIGRLREMGLPEGGEESMAPQAEPGSYSNELPRVPLGRAQRAPAG
jgi:hypothetical protein